MKLLIITQKVDINDDVLGFFHGWVAEFAKKCEKITVICLKKGADDLPENVKVLSLGKETGESRIKYLVNFYKYIWQERKNYDAVFVHMNHEYVLLGGWLWRLWGKKISLWYTHKSVNLKLKIAEKIVDIIFTASKESFRLPSKKLKVLGHGIDVDKYKVESKKLKVNEDRFKIISIGRISPVKDYETLIRAAETIDKENIEFHISVIGGPAVENDNDYFENLKNLVREKKLEKKIEFIGPIPNKNIAQYLTEADIFVNMSHTGSLDKTILEAMACGIPVITCNDAAVSLLKEYSFELIFKKKDPVDLAGKILGFNKLTASRKKEIVLNLRSLVQNGHNLENLINKLLFFLKEL